MVYMWGLTPSTCSGKTPEVPRFDFLVKRLPVEWLNLVFLLPRWRSTSLLLQPSENSSLKTRIPALLGAGRPALLGAASAQACPRHGGPGTGPRESPAADRGGDRWGGVVSLGRLARAELHRAKMKSHLLPTPTSLYLLNGSDDWTLLAPGPPVPPSQVRYDWRLGLCEFRVFVHRHFESE